MVNINRNKMIKQMIVSNENLECIPDSFDYNHSDLKTNIDEALSKYGPNSKIYIHNIISNILNKKKINEVEKNILNEIVEGLKQSDNNKLIALSTLVFIIDKIFLFKDVSEKQGILDSIKNFSFNGEGGENNYTNKLGTYIGLYEEGQARHNLLFGTSEGSTGNNNPQIINASDVASGLSENAKRNMVQTITTELSQPTTEDVDFTQLTPLIALSGKEDPKYILGYAVEKYENNITIKSIRDNKLYNVPFGNIIPLPKFDSSI